MTIEAGVRLGPYEILAPIGAGGMGEVYRARDPRLNRDVAIKVLPEIFLEGEERKARFEREARMLASLNHPGIAAIYSFEEIPGSSSSSSSPTRHILVMELVEGEGLDQKVSSRSLSLEESLSYARQIAEALEAAHEKGIVHRDLKPANVKVTAEGRVKLLDFGLAKVFEDEASASSPSISYSPTLTARATAAGVILGTAAYMSPEQARGKPVDKRTDVWAFGCVLYEMLAGRRAFEGETVSDTLAAILLKEPDWSALPAATPEKVKEILRKCLRRDAKLRLRDIGDARLDLEELAASRASQSSLASAAGESSASARLPFEKKPDVPSPTEGRGDVTRLERGSRRSLYLSWAIAAAFAAALGALALRPRAPLPLVRASLPPPEGTSYWLEPVTPGPPVLSSDGKAVAFSARDTSGAVRLWVRTLDAGAAHALTGTDGAQYPFWSPDGRAIGFFADGKLKTIEAAGGPPVTLCAAEDGKGGSWSPSGVIVFARSSATPLSIVAAGGGEPKDLTKFDEKRGDISHRHPRFLPDGRHFLYLARVKTAATEGNAVVVASLDGGPESVLVRSPGAAEYASGHLLFLRERTLMARPFDPGRLAFKGDAFPIAESVHLPSLAAGFGVFSASQNGVLVYLTQKGESSAKLEWWGRDGKVLGALGEPAQYVEAVVSPDGKTVAASLRDTASVGRDLWVFDVARNLRTRFTFDPAAEQWPVFSPDGRTVTYVSDRKGHFDLYRKALSGSGGEEVLLESNTDKRPLVFTPDGRNLLYTDETKETKSDIWVLPLAPGEKPLPFLRTAFNEYPAAISPDGRFLAYGSDESGQLQLYVTTFPEPGRKWQVSTEPCAYASWSQDGREIVTQGFSGQIWAIEVSTKGGEFSVGASKPLFKLAGAPQATAADFSVTRDHQRFLVRNQRQEIDPLVSLVVNWPAARHAKGD